MVLERVAKGGSTPAEAAVLVAPFRSELIDLGGASLDLISCNEKAEADRTAFLSLARYLKSMIVVSIQKRPTPQLALHASKFMTNQKRDQVTPQCCPNLAAVRTGFSRVVSDAERLDVSGLSDLVMRCVQCTAPSASTIGDVVKAAAMECLQPGAQRKQCRDL